MKKSIVYYTIFFLFGIIFEKYFEISILYTTAAMIICLLCNFISKKNEVYFYLFTFFLLGMIVFNLNDSTYSKIKIKDGSEISITAKVVKVLSTDKENKKSRYIISNAKNKDISFNKNLILSLKSSGKISIGDYIKVEGKIRSPKLPTNPGLFNEIQYTRAMGVSHTIVSKNCLVLEGNSGIYKIMDKVNKYIEKTFDNNLDNKTASVMKKVILGTSEIDKDTIADVKEVGLVHVLAASGLHIGIISSFIYFALGLLNISKRKINFICLFTIWLYAALIGFPVSIVRASTMFSFIILAFEFRRAYDWQKAMAFSAFIVAFINPWSIFSLGFIFSYAATISILSLGPEIKKYFRTNKNSVFATIFAVYIGILPIQFYFFNEVNLISIVANFILLPIFYLMFVFSLLLLLTPSLLTLISVAISKIIMLCSFVFFQILGLFSDFSYTRIMINLSMENMLLYYILVFLFFFGNFNFNRNRINRHQSIYKWSKFLIYYMCLLLIVTALNTVSNKDLIINTIDIGQGDAHLIRCEKTFLIDTGGEIRKEMYDTGEGILFPYLKSLGISELDGVILSHLDMDHCENLLALMDNFKIKKIYYRGFKHEDWQREFLEKSKKYNIKLIEIKNGTKIYLSKNKVIENFANKYSDDENNNSILNILKFGKFKMLFTGDLFKEGEQSLLKNLDKINVLKVGHHGSKTSTSKELLDKIQADYAVISCGRHNTYGHPHKDTLNILNEYKIKTFITKENGNIEIKTNGNVMKIKYANEKEKVNLFEVAIVMVIYLWTILQLKDWKIREDELYRYIN